MLLRADSLASTHAIAAALAGVARAGDIIVLAGDMGAGKTAFAQGFGRALGIEEAITSPTFTLVHSYPIPNSKHTLHHADLYRLETTSDVDELALHELAEFGGIVLIEWGDVAAAMIGDHLEVRLEADDADDDDDHEAADAADTDADHGVTDADDDDDHGADADDTDDDHEATEVADDEPEEPVDEFGLDGSRLVTIEAIGPGWAGRWDRVTRAMEPFRC